MVSYVDVLAARERIRDTIHPTPCLADYALSEQFGRPVYLKGELFQRTGAFKPRGALNWLRTASTSELRAGLGAVSAGNHAVALAWAAQAAGVRLTVAMPANASSVKVEATRNFGAEVILEGDINDAWARMHRLVEERRLTLVHPFDDPRIIAGQGTVGLEIVEQCPHVNAILCPVGGGGLISGLAIAARHLRPKVRIIGVEPEGAATLKHAWLHNGPTRLEHVQTCAWSLGAAIAGEYTYRLSREYVDSIITVPESSIHAGMRHLLGTVKVHAEPGAAVAAGALLDGTAADELPNAGDIVAVVTGGNMSSEELKQFL
ncbi:threonine/serine dehydratase [Aquisalimonas sp.]|uniref:threonine/serine dehydratase n=1 Tax=Aquisalimonas sp. TaxID=1872621 RepID=UPI0025BD804E|nr:threonine/serine dehydratase [Aquisalimonas sp.]